MSEKTKLGHQRGLGKETFESRVVSLKVYTKAISDGADVTFCGRMLHGYKAMSPMVERRVRRTTRLSIDDEAERRC